MLNYFASQPKDQLPSSSLGSRSMVFLMLALVLAYGIGFGIAIWLTNSPTTKVSPCDAGVVCTPLASMVVEEAGEHAAQLAVNGSVTSASHWSFFRVSASAISVTSRESADARKGLLHVSALPRAPTAAGSGTALCAVVAFNKNGAIPMHCANSGAASSEIDICGANQMLIGVTGMGTAYPLHYELQVSLSLVDGSDDCIAPTSKFWLWLFVILLVAGEIVLVPAFAWVALRYYRSKRASYEYVGEMTEGTPLMAPTQQQSFK